MTTEQDNQTAGPFAARARDRGAAALVRARLMDAAAKLLAREDFAGVSAEAIARLAGADAPAFHDHFADVAAIARAAAANIAAAVGAQVAEALLEIGDASQRVARGTRYFVELAAERPDWGKTLVRAYWVFPELRATVQESLCADIERGVAQGMFSTHLEPLLVASLTSMTLGALSARLDGGSPDCGCRAAELQLRALGLRPAAATAIGWKTIPPQTLSARFI